MYHFIIFHQIHSQYYYVHRRGVDKEVLRLLADRTQGNTVAKVHRQVLELHTTTQLYRKDLYLSLLVEHHRSKSDQQTME